MTYYIRAKSYYRYASDLSKNLYQFKNNPAELQKKAQEIFKLGLKAIWALSYVIPPEKSPEFKELWGKTIESLESEDIPEMEKIKNIIFSENFNSEQIINSINKFLEIIRKILQPIL